MASVNAHHGTALDGYDALWRWSVSQRELFWRELWRYVEVLGEPGQRTLEHGDDLLESRWFPDASLNYAENLLRCRDQRTALVISDETGAQQTLSYNELAQQVAAVQAFLRAEGVAAGDRVAGILPNAQHAVVAMLACTALGAVWSSCSPDFGTQGILDRFGQIEPKVLFTVDAYPYAGKTHSIGDKIAAVVAQLPSVRRTVIDGAVPEHVPGAVSWAQVLEAPASDIVFTRVGFRHPLYILYSSGTTGRPKCIVHGHGGTLLQHLKELALHSDIRYDSVLFFYTTCGWMMWNWLVSGLALGCTLVLYEGSPFHPHAEHLPARAEALGITHFGAGAKYYAAAEKAGVETRARRVRTVFSTGSPLSAESFDYLNQILFPGAQVASISGGTDIISCFALGNPLSPVYRGELQGPGLAMDIAFVDLHGHPVDGQQGELVCRQSFPSQPVGFWNDPDQARYRAAYFERFPGWWAHGDFGQTCRHEVPPQMGIQIIGRSDAVLNPGGVRIGTAEIYRQVELIDAVLDSVAVGQRWQGDERIVLFVKLRPGVTLDDELSARIRRQIRQNTTARHVPTKILQVTDVPRTLSGKVAEIAVRNMIHGDEVTNRDALANPETLELYRNLAELRE
jgi:acetoacetyl-CoA synthetase